MSDFNVIEVVLSKGQPLATFAQFAPTIPSFPLPAPPPQNPPSSHLSPLLLSFFSIFVCSCFPFSTNYMYFWNNFCYCTAPCSFQISLPYYTPNTCKQYTSFLTLDSPQPLLVVGNLLTCSSTAAYTGQVIFYCCLLRTAFPRQIQHSFHQSPASHSK